jgi:Ca2+-binding EF-hand superfamily protein
MSFFHLVSLSQGPGEDMDLLVPSAKELKEAKELFRQFDTDGTGMLTVEEIQVWF